MAADAVTFWAFLLTALLAERRVATRVPFRLEPARPGILATGTHARGVLQLVGLTVIWLVVLIMAPLGSSFDPSSNSFLRVWSYPKIT